VSPLGRENYSYASANGRVLAHGPVKTTALLAGVGRPSHDLDLEEGPVEIGTLVEELALPED
jgi:hypothetical protein